MVRNKQALTTNPVSPRNLDGDRSETFVMLAVLAIGLWPGMPDRPLLEMSSGFARLAGPAVLAAAGRTIAGAAQWGDFQLGAYAGPSYTTPSKVRIVQPGGTDLTLHDVHWRGEPFKMPPYYGYRVIVWPGEGSIGFMIDFTHIKAEAFKDHIVDLSGTLDGGQAPERARLSRIFDKLEFTHGYNLLTLNSLYRRRANTSSALIPYLGIGAGLSIPHVEVLRTGGSKETRTKEYQIAGPAFQLLAGVEWRVTGRFTVFLEYKVSCSVNTGLLAGGGTLKTNLCSHQLLTGPALHLRSLRVRTLIR